MPNLKCAKASQNGKVSTQYIQNLNQFKFEFVKPAANAEKLYLKATTPSNFI